MHKLSPMTWAVLFAIVGFAIVIPTAFIFKGIADAQAALPAEVAAIVYPSTTPAPTFTPVPPTRTPAPTSPPTPTVIPPTATAIPTSTPAPTPTADPSAEVAAALSKHMAETVCNPEAWAPDLIPRWCITVKGIEKHSRILVVKTTLTHADRPELQIMMQALSSFVYNNLNKQFGLTTIEVISNINGDLLATRRDRASAFEYF